MFAAKFTPACFGECPAERPHRRGAMMRQRAEGKGRQDWRWVVVCREWMLLRQSWVCVGAAVDGASEIVR